MAAISSPSSPFTCTSNGLTCGSLNLDINGSTAVTTLDKVDLSINPSCGDTSDTLTADFGISVRISSSLLIWGHMVSLTGDIYGGGAVVLTSDSPGGGAVVLADDISGGGAVVLADDIPGRGDIVLTADIAGYAAVVFTADIYGGGAIGIAVDIPAWRWGSSHRC